MPLPVFWSAGGLLWSLLGAGWSLFWSLVEPVWRRKGCLVVAHCALAADQLLWFACEAAQS